ncbi:MAG: beta strand repeat-containing protein, partial [Synechococcus sp.]
MATFIVTTSADENDPGASVGSPGGTGLSLREAIGLANANPDADDIIFNSSVSGPLVLTNGQFLITSDVTINGDTNGDEVADITLDGNNASRILNARNNGVDVELRSLTLTGGQQAGSVGDDGNAGALLIGFGASLDLVNSTVTDSSAASLGGAVLVGAGSTFTSVNSTISGNTAVYGGGVYNANGTANLINTTVSGNVATGGPLSSGGGLITAGSPATSVVINSTFTGNAAAVTTGGVYNYVGGTTTLINTVVSGNSAPSQPEVYSVSSPATIYTGNNIIGDTLFVGSTPQPGTLALSNIFDTVVSVNPGGLGSFNSGQLASNGGVVQTVAIASGGAAQNNGDATQLPSDTFDLDNDGSTGEDLPVDARGIGFARVVGSLDIGAFEIASNAPPTITSDGGGATAAVSIDENTTLVTDVQTNDDLDAEGAGLTYSITGGDDQ